MAEIILVTGGARSGKSGFAELLARRAELPVTYIATAQVWDEEMAVRIANHKQSRPAEWRLIEEPLQLGTSLLSLADEGGVVLVDCVTLWLTNHLLARWPHPDGSDQTIPANRSARGEQSPQSDWPQIEQAILAEVREVATVANQIAPQVIFVTNEVGSGIVPENPLARYYRDLAGRANQILAQRAEAVYLVVAGYPVEIKQRGEVLLASLQPGGNR